MTAAAPVTYAVDADGVGWITFDDPGARANVFNPTTQLAFERALDALDADAGRVKAAVIVSDKERIFIGGADLRWLQEFRDVDAATEFSRRGQRLFQRVADASVPVVAAIHGACAGGGFELALACHWRIATDAAATQIGLPETNIGTIPGWGGSVRLPRLVGVKPALDHILKGQLVPADAALAAGLVNETCAESELRMRAKRVALRLAAEGVPPHALRAALPDGEIEAMRASVRKRFGSTQPAMLTAIDAVERTAALATTDALDVEARLFGQVTAEETCRNLIHVFFLRDAAKKRTLADWFENRVGRGLAGAGTMAPARVGVVGAGVMGSGIAQWLAARGVDVSLRDAQPEALERGMRVVRGLFDEGVKRGKFTPAEVEAASRRVTAATTWEGFSDCDLVIEAIVEDVAAKRRLFSELADIVRVDAVLASNTSALPIEEIAGHVAHPERTIGIHFFNPVSRMPLVEIVLARSTSAEVAARALALVKALGKSPVICRSSPGFLVTRVLFFYLNAAVQVWEDGASTAELDGALREFGWPMGPLRLIDEVGVDVTEFIFGEMAHYFPSRFVRTNACARLLAAGLKGRKNGASRGFYRYDGGGVERVNDEETIPLLTQRATRGSTNPTAIQETLMRVMVEEARRCLDEGVIKTANEVDFALLAGAGFPAFRGGLMRWARAAGWTTSA